MIETASLAFSFARGPAIFSGLDWVATPGTVSALTGRSGRGKSTLLALLGLTLRPSSGEVVLAGRSTSHLSDRQRSLLRAETIGFLFQDAALDPTRTVLANVCEPAVYRGIPRRDVVAQALELLDDLGVVPRASAKPGQVSGGQAQRIALCRALLGDPPLILADEPTGNLDSQAAQVVIDALIERAGRGATVVIATHDSSVVARCDQELAL